jgi:hypothetical protein
LRAAADVAQTAKITTIALRFASNGVNQCRGTEAPSSAVFMMNL